MWYDQNAKERSFEIGDEVLILLPMCACSLEAQWQGPYKIEERVGTVDYLVHIKQRNKSRLCKFHINMLKEYKT